MRPWLLVAIALVGAEECPGGACAVPGDAPGLERVEECPDGVCPVPNNAPGQAVAPDFQVLDADDEDADDEMLEPSPTAHVRAAAGGAASAPGPPASEGKAAAPPAAAAATTAPFGAAAAASKLGKSKVAGAAAAPVAAAPVAASLAAGADADADADANAAPPFDLNTELQLMKVMAETGSTGLMMDVLVNATFALADANRDGKLSQAEGRAFAAAHLRDESPLSQVLGLSGGHVPLDNEAKVAAMVGAIAMRCDTDRDRLISRAEAKECRQYVYDLLVDANELLQQHATAAAKEALELADSRRAEGAAGAAGAAAGDAAVAGASGGADALKQWLEAKQARAAAGTAAGVSQAARAPAKSPVQREIGRRVAQVRRTVSRHWRQPNLNTALACVGGGLLLLRELLALNLFNIGHAMRGLVGGNLPEFSTRLLHVAGVAILAAAYGSF